MEKRTKHQYDRMKKNIHDGYNKPQNNKVVCPGCGRPKQLFESESKADNFIKYNKQYIRKGEFLRSYYCACCGSWHITSHEYKEEYTEQMNELTDISHSKYQRHDNAKQVANQIWHKEIPVGYKKSTQRLFNKYVKDVMKHYDVDKDMVHSYLVDMFKEYQKNMKYRETLNNA